MKVINLLYWERCSFIYNYWMSNLAYFLCNRGFLLCCYCMTQRRWRLFGRVYAATMHRLIAATGCIAIVQLILWLVIIVVTHAHTRTLSLAPSLSLSLSLSLSFFLSLSSCSLVFIEFDCVVQMYRVELYRGRCIRGPRLHHMARAVAPT